MVDQLHTHLVLAVIVRLLQLPVDERSLGLGAALQEHAAVLHAVNAPVLHAAQPIHIVCADKTHSDWVRTCGMQGALCVCVWSLRVTLVLQVRALGQRVPVPDILPPGSPKRKRADG